MERKEQVAKIGKAFDELVNAIAETTNEIKTSIATKVSTIAELKHLINDEFETLMDIANIADNAVIDFTDLVVDIDKTTSVVDEVLASLDEVPTSIEVVEEDTELSLEDIEEDEDIELEE